MTSAVFDKGMKRLVTVYERELTDERVAAYWDALSDLSDGAFELAVRQAVRRCKFFPRPSELWEFAAAQPPALP